MENYTNQTCPICGSVVHTHPAHEDETHTCRVCGGEEHTRPSCGCEKKPCSDHEDMRHDCPEHGRPGYDRPEHGCPEHGRPEHGCPEHGRPEHGRPEHGCPEHGRPEHGCPGHDRPEHGCPEHDRPEHGCPEYNRPCGCGDSSCPVCGNAADSCPVCDTPPSPLCNTASAAGQYRCCAGCRGDVSAISAPVVTEVVDVTLDKAVSSPCARTGQSVRYTITICNRSSIPVSHVKVTDPGIEKCLEVGTIYYNGRPVKDGCLSKGIHIPGIGAGCCAAITFEATVPEGTTGTICNVAYACFEFATSCGVTRQDAASNEVTLSIVSPCLEIQKNADRCSVTAEENVVTYTLTTCNTGTCPIENVVVTDVLPTGLTYVPCSTSVRGCAPTDRNPAAGICLGTLCAGETAVVTFQAAASFTPC